MDEGRRLAGMIKKGEGMMKMDAGIEKISIGTMMISEGIMKMDEGRRLEDIIKKGEGILFSLQPYSDSLFHHSSPIFKIVARRECDSSIR
jgi:hypothetical protein